ncbi:hypothetical protein AVEN_69419-1 [Araneus ventricosus]|uniref:Uncharacterized protein n=1 Tax=Araneus ventricosus TaxID=182803 RepID=A0A4Y2KCW5_ARAVE|nr:hypothetical protein AVEN_69419-1 [Araneus ventricosus]
MSFRTLPPTTVPNFKTTSFSFSIFPSLTGLFLPKPLSCLKSEIKSAVLSIWQDNWDNGETASSTRVIVPRVSNKPIGWNREEIMFVTEHGPFPSSLQSSNA